MTDNNQDEVRQGVEKELNSLFGHTGKRELPQPTTPTDNTTDNTTLEADAAQRIMNAIYGRKDK